MNKRMLTTLQFVLLSLNIKGAAGNVQLKEEHVKRFAANLYENNQAHIDHKQPKTDVTYTTFHLANRKISVKNFLSLFQTLYGKTTQKKRFTIITIRSRNGCKTDNEDINRVNFITAMQKQLTGETRNSVVTNNLTVTVNVIEEDRILDLDLLYTTNDTIASIYSKLSSLFISSITDILSIMFKQCLISHFFSIAHWLAQRHLENEGYTSPEQYYIDNWSNMPKTMQNEFNIFRIKNYLTTVPSEYKTIIDKIHREIVAFEQKIGFKYFTTNIMKCDRALDRMFDYFYVEVLRDSFYDLSPIAANIAGDQNHKEKLKTAFADGFEAILQHYKSKKASQKNTENIESRDSEPTEGGGCHFKAFYKFFYDFFETIDFDQIKNRLPESHTKRFEKLKGELELPYTRIVYCGKIAIKNLPLIIDVLLEAKVFKDLNVRQTLYIEEDKVVNDDVRLLGDSTYGKKSFDLLNGYKYTVDANEKIEVYSKTKIAESELEMSASLGCTNPMRQNSTKNKTEGNKMSDELNTISIVEYADQVPEAKHHSIIGLLLDNIMKVNDSKFECLHELTVKCGLSLTDIYILRHVSNDLKTEKITVVCGDKEDFGIKTSERKKPKGNILCLDNIPLTILDDLYIYLSVLQYTNAPVFSFPNVWIANDSQIISTGKTVSSIHLINKTCSLYREYFKSGNAICTFDVPNYVPMYNLLYYHKCKTYSGYEKRYIKKLGLQPADFDQIIRKSVFNSGPCDTLSIDSFLNDDHRTTEKVEFFAMKPNKETTILYVVVRKNNNDLIDTFNYNIKVLENLLDNEKQNSTLSDFTEIEKSHDMNIKLITLILNDLSKLKYFDISLEKWESTEETYKLDLLKRLDSFLNSNEHYGQVGKDSYNNSPSKPTLSSMFKPLLEQKIDELLKIIFEEKKKLMSSRIKISYFKIVKTGRNIGGQFAESLRDMDYVEYRNLEMLDIKVEDERKTPGRQINV